MQQNMQKNMQHQAELFGNKYHKPGFVADLDTRVQSTGNPLWPENDLIELVSQQAGIDELQALMPLMKEATQNNKKILWVSPPGFTYAPYLVSYGIDISKLRVVPSECACNDVIRFVEQAVADNEHAIIVAWLDWLPNSVVQRIRTAMRSCDNASIKLAFLLRRHRQKIQIKRTVSDCRILH